VRNHFSPRITPLQVDIIAAYGERLLEWLQKCARTANYTTKLQY
jgi:hypothetical protein